MLKDFAHILGRVQADFGFYLSLRNNPSAALKSYHLDDAEREALLDPEKMSRVIESDAVDNKPHRLVVTFSGRHDWINKHPRPIKKRVIVDVDAQIATAVQTIRHADTHQSRVEATLGLLAFVE